MSHRLLVKASAYKISFRGVDLGGSVYIAFNVNEESAHVKCRSFQKVAGIPIITIEVKFKVVNIFKRDKCCCT